VGFFLGQQQPPRDDLEWLLGAELVEQTGQVYFSTITAGGPAANAGIEAGDRLVALERQAVGSTEQLARILAGYEIGDLVRVEVDHRHRIEQYQLYLGLYTPVVSATPVTLVTPVVVISPPPPPSSSQGDARLGVYYRMLAENDPFAVADGALIITAWAGGAAEEAGLQPGDIITEVAGRQLSQDYTLQQALDNLGGGQRVTLKVWRAAAGQEESVQVMLK